MSFYVAAILKALLLEAAAVLGLTDAQLRRGRSSRAVLAFVYLALIGATAYGFLGFGPLRGTGDIVHWPEQYHFDLGDKYLREMRYDGLYLATAADRLDRGESLAGVDIRDTSTFDMIPLPEVEARVAEVRTRFSPARWQEFKGDLAALLAENGGAANLGDHGNTSSPAGAIGPWLLMKVIPLRGVGFRLLAWVDVVLVVLSLLACWRWASLRVAALTAAVILSTPMTMDFLFGSLFRFDWLAACLGAVLALHRGRRATAGALLAYAALARPFAIGFALCAGMGLAGDVLRRRVSLRAALRLPLGAVVAGIALVGASAALFEPAIWPAYLQRMAATVHEGYYPINFTLRDIVTQVTRDGLVALVHPVPDVIAAARWQGAPPGSAAVVRDLALAVVAIAAALDGAVLGSACGVLAVFVAVPTNLYYQTMWGVFALACALAAPRSVRARVGIAAACALFASRYVFQHLGAWRHAEMYFPSWATMALGSAWLAAILLARLRAGLTTGVERPRSA